MSSTLGICWATEGKMAVSVYVGVGEVLNLAEPCEVFLAASVN